MAMTQTTSCKRGGGSCVILETDGFIYQLTLLGTLTVLSDGAALTLYIDGYKLSSLQYIHSSTCANSNLGCVCVCVCAA